MIAYDLQRWEVQRNGLDGKLGTHKAKWRDVISGFGSSQVAFSPVAFERAGMTARIVDSRAAFLDGLGKDCNDVGDAVAAEYFWGRAPLRRGA